MEGNNMNSDPQAYWKANIRLVLGCLAVWFFISYGCGILFADPLNRIKILGGLSARLLVRPARIHLWLCRAGVLLCLAHEPA
jgi:uncharacterized membrane protein